MAQKNQVIHRNTIPDLIREIRQIILSARTIAARSVDTIQVMTNYQIGHLIVEHEQHGARRAAYGKDILNELSKRLFKEFGRGFSRSNLEYMRKFYLAYNPVFAEKSQTLSGKSTNLLNNTTPCNLLPISQTAPGKSSARKYLQTLSANSDRMPTSRITFQKLSARFTLSWSLRELKRQFNTSLYERLALSRDKKSIHKMAAKGQIIEKPQDLIKNPYVLEFLGLDEKAEYSETDLENAIIDRLEEFLLELGKGFLFESRQKRFTFDDDHFYVDLVFYNRILKCYVLFDLKIGKLTHQDLGQMQMYVNYFDRYVKQRHENQTVGIILCREKKDAMIEITLPKNANIRASQYQLYLPSKVQLKQKLIDWTRKQQEQ